MEGCIQNVQNVVHAATAYKNNSSDINQTQLIRQLEYLISVTAHPSSLNCLNPRELVMTECLAYLVQVLDADYNRSSLAQKIMLLFNNLANKKDIRRELQSTYDLTACLARFLKNQYNISAADPNSLLCLKLLHKVSYECKVAFQEDYIEHLIQFLIDRIKGKEDELTLPCLGVLANLCRNNLSVQVLVINQRKQFGKVLSGFLGHRDNSMVIPALSCMVSLSRDGDDKLFSSPNIDQVFLLLFTTLTRSGDLRLRTNAVDVFTDLLKNSKIKKSLSVYKQLDQVLSKLLELLPKGKGEDAAKLFELLVTLCSVNGLRCSLCRQLLGAPVAMSHHPTPQLDVLQAIIHWASQTVDTHSDAPLLAIEFLREMYEEILEQGIVATATPQTEKIVSMLMSALTQSEIPTSGTGRKHCQKLQHALQLTLLLSSEKSLIPLLGAAISPTVCMNLIEHQFHHNKLSLSGIRWSPITDSTDWSEDGASVLLYTIDVMMALRQPSGSSMDKQLAVLLQDPRIVTYLSHGLTEGVNDLVQIVLRVISHGVCLPEFPLSILGDRITAKLNQKQAENKHSENKPSENENKSSARFSSQNILESSVTWNKENVLSSTRLDHPGTVPYTSKANHTLNSTVETLIEKIQNNFELKDARSSDIMHMYEHRVQGLQTEKKQLEDLLEAKVLAMGQADRLIIQHRQRAAQTEAELEKMRTMVREYEQRSEDLRERNDAYEVEKERMSNDLEQMALDNERLEHTAEEYRDLSEKFTEQTEKLENTQSSLVALKKEHQCIQEMQEMSRRHIETLKQQHDAASEQLIKLKDERKTITKQLKDKDAKLQDSSKNFSRTEKELKKITKEKTALEVALEQFRADLTSSDQLKRELERKVSHLEYLCEQQGNDLKEKESILKQQKQDIEKQEKIQALIRDITSGNAPSS